MKKGTGTGKEDDYGVEIKCGDHVSLYERREGYFLRIAQDGWGRDKELCVHEQKEVPMAEKTTRGIVAYSKRLCAFVVLFEESLLESGRTEENLCCLGSSKSNKHNRLLVLAQGEI